MNRDDGVEDKKKLAILDELVIAEILATPGDEILNEFTIEEIAQTRAKIFTVRQAVGRKRMAEAKTALAIERARPNVIPTDRSRGAAALRLLRAQDPKLDQQLTLAARNASTQVEADQYGIEEDLAELESWISDNQSRET
jgi:hypothetical protein